MIFYKTVIPRWKSVLSQVYQLPSNRNIHVSVMLKSSQSFYEILRIPPTASQTEIKEAYYKLSKVYHPDIAKDENSLKMFRNITEAYDTLGSINSRLRYDKEIGYEQASSTGPGVPTSLYRDEEKGKHAPAYDELLKMKNSQQHWEDLELKDRRTEVLMKKTKAYMRDIHEAEEPHFKLFYFLGLISALGTLGMFYETMEDRRMHKNMPHAPFWPW